MVMVHVGRQLSRIFRPGSTSAHVARYISEGSACARQKNWIGAASAYRKALARNRNMPEIWVQLAHALKEGKDSGAAVTAYVTATEVDPGHDDAYFHLAYLLRDLGDRGGSFKAFRACYDLTGNPIARRELSDLIGTVTDYEEIMSVLKTEFDAQYYLDRNADVRMSGAEPLFHFLMYGWRENRIASRAFDPGFYTTQYRRFIPKRVIPLVHYALTGRKLGLRGNPAGDGLWFEPKAPSAEAWRALPSAKRTAETRAVVILPVYKGYDETLAAVYHAVASRAGSPYSLLVINDCGPDKALNAALTELKSLDLFDYEDSPVNRGFVRTCNYGIDKLSGGLDVVLLNSDAFVFPGWFDRLAAHAYADPKVATVTPLSNNATICSYPVTDRENANALELTGAELDQLAARVNRGVAVETPTGVGFCFFMSRKVIDEIGALDPVAFKVGYGEENDFCMRSLNAGYRNLIACDVFVHHVGSVSFSSIKDQNFSAGQAALIEKHPNYPTLTRRHVVADPVRPARRRLDLERMVAAFGGSVCIVTHSWGGGVDKYLNDIVDNLTRAGQSYYIIRVHDRHRVSVETDPARGVYLPNLVGLDMRVEADLVAALIERVRPASVHVNSFAGADWPTHRRIVEVIGGSGIPYTYVCHDYSAVSYNYQLMRPDGIYSGLPTVEDLRAWSRMDNSDRFDLCDTDERLAVYRSFLKGAAAVEAPSEAARDILAAFYPEANYVVVPHAEHLAPADFIPRRSGDGRIRVAVLGAIGPHKGSGVLLALAMDARARGLKLEFHVVGYTDQDPAMRNAGIAVTGAYQSDEEAIAHLDSIRPDVVLIPSVWPETYCYTLSLAIHCGIPPVVFDLGAQGERVRALGWGVVLDPWLINTPTRINDRLGTLDLGQLWARRSIAVRSETLKAEDAATTA